MRNGLYCRVLRTMSRLFSNQVDEPHFLLPESPLLISTPRGSGSSSTAYVENVSPPREATASTGEGAFPIPDEVVERLFQRLVQKIDRPSGSSEQPVTQTSDVPPPQYHAT